MDAFSQHLRGGGGGKGKNKKRKKGNRQHPHNHGGGGGGGKKPVTAPDDPNAEEPAEVGGPALPLVPGQNQGIHMPLVGTISTNPADMSFSMLPPGIFSAAPAPAPVLPAPVAPNPPGHHHNGGGGGGGHGGGSGGHHRNKGGGGGGLAASMGAGNPLGPHPAANRPNPNPMPPLIPAPGMGGGGGGGGGISVGPDLDLNPGPHGGGRRGRRGQGPPNARDLINKRRRKPRNPFSFG